MRNGYSLEADPRVSGWIFGPASTQLCVYRTGSTAQLETSEKSVQVGKTRDLGVQPIKPRDDILTFGYILLLALQTLS